MYEIDSQEMTPEFFECWKAAGMHLNTQVQGGIQGWLRAHPYPPFLEHLSFRLGNQLFFIRIVVDSNISGPGNMKGLLALANEANGHACLMPMKRSFPGRKWCPQESGWGLVDASNNIPVDPSALVTNDKIEMTSWETHDMAVQVVREHLESQGHQIMSWQSNPQVDPALWFVGKSKKPEWVAIRAARYPKKNAQRPDNWNEIADHCSRISPVGHFASVAFASTDQKFSSENEAPTPLWRGHGLHVAFLGLE